MKIVLKIFKWTLTVILAMVLVSALYGYEKTMAAYKVAVEEKYRFFSFGDAMLIL